MASRRPHPPDLDEKVASAPSSRDDVTKRARVQTSKHGGQKYPSWTFPEKAAFVEYIALHHDHCTKTWPAYSAAHALWEEAAEFVCSKVGTPKRTASAMRVMCTKEFAKQFETMDAAETYYKIDYFGYREVDTPISPSAKTQKEIPQKPKTPIELLLEMDLPELLDNMDTILVNACRKHGLKLANRKYISTYYQAMKVLEAKGRPNVVASLAEVLAKEKMPLDRMPWGLIEYQIQFFNSDHINQLSIPEHLAQWTESVLSQARGATVLLKMLRGPMWTGYKPEDRGKTSLARVNVALPSEQTLRTRLHHSDFTPLPVVQKKALESLPKENHYWIKLDGTDLKAAVLESTKGEWSGDVDLGDGKLATLECEYRRRNMDLQIAKNSVNVRALIVDLKADITYLETAHVAAAEAYRAKSKKVIGLDALKDLSWACLETQELLRIAHVFLLECTSKSYSCPAIVTAYLKEIAQTYKEYLRDLFKKKRVAATHVLVVMVADEQRTKKPYSIPVMFVPYATLRDQYVRDLLVSVKRAMIETGLTVEGVVTDGEFHTLRTRGDTRSIHLYQIIHDAKDSVRKMRATAIESMLTPVAVDQNSGQIIARLPNDIVPQEVLRQIWMMLEEGNTFDQVLQIIRQQLVPLGYMYHSFRENIPESHLDRLRSILATYLYRKTLADFLSEGVDFYTYLYNPEVDGTTGQKIHERSDHNHLLKRIAASTREGKYQNLDLEAFDQAVQDKRSGLTHVALVGLRKQSVPDAERLLSFEMARYMHSTGHEEEAVYIETIARWHEASDGRGLKQLERCKANYGLLNYLLDHWMPWHRHTYDFSTIDINGPMTCIRGFTYQTLIEVTANIEGQEMRRRQNAVRGFAEHPRAATTDDNEGFFSLTRRVLGGSFTLADFGAAFPRIVREFVRKTDATLPFYYHTLNEQYHLEQGGFDETSTDTDEQNYVKSKNKERLHRSVRTRREDSSIIVAGRNFLPAKNQPHLRRRIYAPDVGLPPVPEHLIL